MSKPNFKKLLSRNRLTDTDDDESSKAPFENHIPQNQQQWAQFFMGVLSEKIELKMNYKCRTAFFQASKPKKYREVLMDDNWNIEAIHLFHVYLWYLKNAKFQKFIEIMRTVLPDNMMIKGLQQLKLKENYEAKILLHYIRCFSEGNVPMFFNEIPLQPHEWIAIASQLQQGQLQLSQLELLDIQADDDGLPSNVSILPHFHALVLFGNVQKLKKANKLPKKATFTLESPMPQAAAYHWDGIAAQSIQWTTALCSKKKHHTNSVSFLIYGPPGTGKTAFAHSLAHEIKGQIMQVNYAQLHSKWVGETEKNVEHVFRQYAELSQQSTEPIILLLNEADGIFAPRVEIKQSNDIHANNVQIQLLEWMEKFNGILIATTNKKEHLDEAFNRRFLFKIKLSGITQAQREKMVKHSPILRYLSPTLKQELLRQEWNPGQWTNAEKKILALCECIEIAPEWIEEIFRDEGMLTPVKKLGFANYSSAERSAPRAAES